MIEGCLNILVRTTVFVFSHVTHIIGGLWSDRSGRTILEEFVRKTGTSTLEFLSGALSPAAN